jgi:hypothetical protein
MAKDRVTKLQNATMPVDYCMLAGVPHAKNESYRSGPYIRRSNSTRFRRNPSNKSKNRD